MASKTSEVQLPAGDAPHPGSHWMPRWELGTLHDAPVFTWRSWTMLLGPGLVMGASAIGGGEWLTGPLVTARYGAALFWLSTLSILAQVLYNIEISRYTLYSGEPIFTGKFRILPGPIFWLFMYVVLDFGSVLPYLASNAAVPLAAILFGQLPDPKAGIANVNLLGWQTTLSHAFILKGLGCCIFLVALTPVMLGGKIYNWLKALMSFKLVYVMGFLLFLAIMFSTFSVWKEIAIGFVSFGNVPVQSVIEDSTGAISPAQLYQQFAEHPEAANLSHQGKEIVIHGRIAAMVEDEHVVELQGERGNNIILKVGPSQFKLMQGKLKLGVGQPLTFAGRNANWSDGVISVQPQNVANVFTTWWRGEALPPLDLTMLGILAAMAAISGNGGLTNTPISNYTRDQGWGMGREVGAIPSVVGKHTIELSHVGKVFLVTPDSLKKWYGWVRHVQREQLVVWMPACFLGLALPGMLSMQFLPRGTELKDSWLAAGMTAQGVADAVGGKFGPSIGPLFWYLTLFCGFLILSTSMAMTADGCLRRWVDVSWTAVPALRRWETRHIGRFYFIVMCCYAVGGLLMLTFVDGTNLLVFSTMMYNYALGASCWHALAVNTILLPKQLRPSYWRRALLLLAGMFFITIAVVTTMDKLGVFEAKEPPKTTAQHQAAASFGIRIA